ncbi:MAG: filamentous hemagglutinin N-terminal domain-containing protein [Ectothiorhodospiraceae bacterium]|nr:filamentous hemagglutinin N-terminal domain-containing protein [Ectothiorhodospiraceae bacterium]
MRAAIRLASAFLAAAGAAGPSLAQITLDGTVGHFGPAALTGPDYRITHDMGERRGGNLFHSFGRFDVFSGESATFTGPADIANVISRVTGGSASVIDGLLASRVGSADFYLVNPAGLTFGPNAVLDVPAAFHGSTAHYLRLGDHGIFHATDPGASVLSVSPPSAFGFLGPTAPVIALGSALEVAPGAELALVGGDVLVEPLVLAPVLRAPGGQITVVSAAGSGEVPIGADRAYPTAGVSALGDIEVVGPGALLASGTGRGRLVIRGGNLTLVDVDAFADTRGPVAAAGIDVELRGTLGMSGARLTSDSLSEAPAGPVRVVADRVLLVDGASISSEGLSTGDAGTLSVVARELVLADGSRINSDSGLGASRGGDVEVVADNVIIDGSAISSDAFGAGRAGDVRVSGAALSLLDASVSSNARRDTSGAAGSVTLTFDGAVRIERSTVSSESFGTGNAGAVTVTAGELALLDGAEVNSNSGVGDSRGGAVTVRGETVHIEGGRVASDTFGAGRAGDVRVEGARIALADSVVTSNAREETSGAAGSVTVNAAEMLSLEGSTVSSESFGTGDAGTVTVRGEQRVSLDDSMVNSNAGVGMSAGGDVQVGGNVVELTGSTVSSESFGTGNAGAVRVVGGARVQLVDTVVNSNSGVGTSMGGDVRVEGRAIALTGSTVSSDTFGAGRAGDVRVTGATLSMLDSVVSGNTRVGTTGRAGSVLLALTEAATMDGSVVSSESFGGGDAGAVVVRAPRLALQRGSSINTDAGAGPSAAGDLLVEAEDLVLTASSISSDSFSDGRAGNVTVRAGSMGLTDAFVSSDAAAAGHAGSVAVTVDGALGLDQSAISSESIGLGNAGAVRVTTGRLSLERGAAINTDSGVGVSVAGDVAVVADRIDLGGGASVSSDSHADGRAGNVTVRGGDVHLDGAFVSSDALADGDAGTVTVVATRSLALDGGAAISTESVGAGNAGAVTVAAPRLEIVGDGSISSASTATGLAGDIVVAADTLILRDSSITTAARVSDGGSIKLDVGDLVLLVDSAITAEVFSGVGSGGNVDIDPRAVILQRSEVVANAFGGPGGNIRIVAGVFFASADSVVSASSAQSIDGTVVIDSPDADVTAGLTVLPATFLDAVALLQARCAARRSVDQSSLVDAGPGGVPPSPDGYLPSVLAHDAPAAGAPGSPPGAIAWTPQLWRAALSAAGCSG